MASCPVSNALQLLAAYQSDDSDNDCDSELTKHRTSRKRKKLEGVSHNSSAKRLPLPKDFDSLFAVENKAHNDDPRLHEGRTRSFPHERGNWATCVYIPYDPQPVFHSLVDVVIAHMKEVVDIKPLEEFHISLTRTVILRHHWINSFVDSVQEAVKELPRFRLNFNSLKVYCNENRSRTFIGLTVLLGLPEICKCVTVLDRCLADFKLPPFYEKPSFHLSVAWCLGDHKDKVSLVLPQLQIAFKQFTHAHPEKWELQVEKLLCKSGNKLFAFHFAS